MRSRPVRIASAILFALVIVSPAAVVFAVVWNSPSVAQPAAPIDNEPARLLPAPDAQQGPLPTSAVNVYANTL
ncbi:MAG: hypothetical protein E6J40_08505, partial [Chloroflexi bacterium]